MELQETSSDALNESMWLDQPPSPSYQQLSPSVQQNGRNVIATQQVRSISQLAWLLRSINFKFLKGNPNQFILICFHPADFRRLSCPGSQHFVERKTWIAPKFSRYKSTFTTSWWNTRQLTTNRTGFDLWLSSVYVTAKTTLPTQSNSRFGS